MKSPRLKILRKKAIELQQLFMDLLVSDTDDLDKETKLEKAFGFFLWEIDEAIRNATKEEEPK